VALGENDVDKSERSLMPTVELTEEEFEALYGLLDERYIALDPPQPSTGAPHGHAILRRVMAKLIQSQARERMQMVDLS
jgi:hypothetical protein